MSESLLKSPVLEKAKQTLAEAISHNSKGRKEIALPMFKNAKEGYEECKFLHKFDYVFVFYIYRNSMSMSEFIYLYADLRTDQPQPDYANHCIGIIHLCDDVISKLERDVDTPPLATDTILASPPGRSQPSSSTPSTICDEQQMGGQEFNILFYRAITNENAGDKNFKLFYFEQSLHEYGVAVTIFNECKTNSILFSYD